MKKLILTASVAIVSVFSAIPPVHSLELDTLSAREEIGFKIDHLKMFHQEIWRTLDIIVWYHNHQNSGQVPDTTEVKESLLQFLRDYSNGADYWEILNTNILKFLKQAYPSLDAIEIELSVVPDEIIPYHRKSIVVGCGKFYCSEGFGFKLDTQETIQNELKNAVLEVTYTYKEGIQPNEYPDFLWLGDAIDAYLKEHWGEGSRWDLVKPVLTAYLLEKFPMVEQVEITLNAN